MLSASQSMSQLILGKGQSQDEEVESKGTGAVSKSVSNNMNEMVGGSALLDALEGSRLERASTAVTFESGGSTDAVKAEGFGSGARSLPRSQTAPGELPFVAASYRREFFDFEVNYIVSPPMSKNVRLAPLADARRSRMEAAARKADETSPEKTELEAAFDGAVVQ